MSDDATPAKVRLTDGLGPTPPLPRKKPAVFHHPMGFELYDALAMDLHAMTYAEPLFAEIARLTDELRDLRAWQEKAFQAHTNIDLDIEALVDLGPNVGIEPPKVGSNDGLGSTGDEQR